MVNGLEIFQGFRNNLRNKVLQNEKDLGDFTPPHPQKMIFLDIPLMSIPQMGLLQLSYLYHTTFLSYCQALKPSASIIISSNES